MNKYYSRHIPPSNGENSNAVIKSNTSDASSFGCKLQKRKKSKKMAAGNVVWNFFVPSVTFSVVFYAIILILYDLTFTCSVGFLGLVAAVIFLIKFALPSYDEEAIVKFFAAATKTPTENDGSSSTTKNKRETSDFTPKSANDAKTFVVAHRTLALDAPENSISGIQQAGQNGFSAVEFDVQLSKDLVPVVFHDPTVDRVSGTSGRVADLTLGRLKQIDISKSHLLHEKYEGETVPTLVEAITKCLQLNLKVVIDVKTPHQKILSSLLELFSKLPELKQRSLVACWSPFFLYQLRRCNADICTGLVWRPRMLSLHCPLGILEYGTPRFREKWKFLLALLGDVILDWLYHALLWFPCGISVILAHKDAISKEYLRMWKTRGMKILAWPVNDPLEKQYYANVLKIGYLTDTCLPHP